MIYLALTHGDAQCWNQPCSLFNSFPDYVQLLSWSQTRALDYLWLTKNGTRCTILQKTDSTYHVWL